MSRASALLSLQQIDDRIATLTLDIAAVEASLRGDPELDRLRAAEAAAHEEHRTLGAGAGEWHGGGAVACQGILSALLRSS